MTSCILGNQYIPSAAYFAHWLQHGRITLEAHEHYQKRNWRNKTAILGAERPLVLTVPLEKGKHQQMNIQDVRIAYHEPWVKQHLHSIQTAYGKTAFYEEIRPDLTAILETGMTTLWDLNLHLLRFMAGLLPGTWLLSESDTYIHHYPSTVTDLRTGIPAGIVHPALSGYPEYLQVQRLERSHLANLSILDVLCHLGQDTGHYLRQCAEKLYEAA